MIDPTNTTLTKMVSALGESQRLSSLTNAELVAEAVKSDASDYLVVSEMMDRLDPDWSKQPDEQPLQLTPQPQPGAGLTEQERDTDAIVRWHIECAENHEDWSRWFRKHPDKLRESPSVGDPEHHDEAARMHRVSATRLAAAEADNTEHRAFFDRMWEADQRGIKAWQQATGKDMVCPDRGDLVKWLLEEVERLKEQLSDAQSLAAEVALGFTHHSTVCTEETPCVRCQRDALDHYIKSLPGNRADAQRLREAVEAKDKSLRKIADAPTRHLDGNNPDELREWAQTALTPTPSPLSPATLASVNRGIADAKAGRFAPSPQRAGQEQPATSDPLKADWLKPFTLSSEQMRREAEESAKLEQPREV